MATSPKRPIRLRILGDDTVKYPNELLANIADKKLSLYDADGGSTIDFYSGVDAEVTGTGNAITGATVSGNKISLTKGSTFLTAHPSVTKSTDGTSTASPSHGGTFTAVDGVTRDTFGHVTKINTKTVTLPSETGLSLGTATGTGNAVTGITVSGHTITLNKGNTFLTAHPSITKSTDSTSTATPALGGTFTAVDSITRDTNGHVTKINTKTVTLPTVSIPDVSKYVSVGTSTEMVDENPETFDGHTVSEFVLKTEVVNNLTSTATNVPLSAAQGKALNDAISTVKSTASSASTAANNAMPKSGGTLTGVLTAQSNTSYTTRQVRNVVLSTSAPSSTDGQNGDIWLVYTA